MSRAIYILSVSDSRGRGSASAITEALPEDLDNITTTECSKGGADIEQLFAQIRRQSRKIGENNPTNKIAVLLQGGICSLTTKSRGEISYKPSHDTVQKLKDSYNQIIEYCTVISGNNIHFTCVTEERGAVLHPEKPP